MGAKRDAFIFLFSVLRIQKRVHHPVRALPLQITSSSCLLFEAQVFLATRPPTSAQLIQEVPPEVLITLAMWHYEISNVLTDLPSMLFGQRGDHCP